MAATIGRPSLSAVTREQREAREEWLSPLATRSAGSRGREREEAPDPYRTEFERDRDRILHSKAFRRLKHKTQVFINPEGDHFVTRMSHTLHVTQVARSLATALGLNETLTEAICLAHDCGHTPFGHTGEAALSDYIDGGEWLHSEQGVRIFRVLEPRNLTWEVLDGVRAHTWRVKPPPRTPEGWVCRYADRIAYLNHDLQDALRAGVIEASDIPSDVIEILGPLEGRSWINAMIEAVIDESLERGKVVMRADVLQAMKRFREFMFERVYLRPEAVAQNERARRVIHQLVDHLIAHPELIPESYCIQDADRLTQVLDFVAGMTDRYALNLYDRSFRPRGLV
ncbi:MULTISPECIES: HD domain-containing protein [unclassified Wenzhouxiangella]|uniref:HD domain-containing protein n=1 Tax=unclassified Wenzhouxiangella TaxID=2613841 RepID=UPI000E32722C|nr:MULTISPECIES: HD domain-containing protein [unclassified Wenzhouxiangella]RFF28096.1 HD domain-containing protein [Wenzhouxiangella sp. 15181]RFP68107.1 HD domain-containing protein [Wenzhouxiangella sp. 15190]